MGSKGVAGIIEAIAKAKECLEELVRIYRSLPDLLGNESKAIAGMNMPEVDRFTQTKLKLAGVTEAKLGELQEAFQQAGALLQELFAVPGGEIYTLSELCKQLGACHEQIESPLERQLCMHMTDELKKIHTEFQRQYNLVQPILEVQREAAGLRLQYLRESFQFWMNIEMEYLSQYDKQGKRAEQNRSSFIQTRA